MITGNFHLTYCTNIHPGESWDETFSNLQSYTLKIAGRIASGKPFGIGLRLSALAAEELLQGNQLPNFRRWLLYNNLYVFTINGFPYGQFHNKKVKELVHKPDWSSARRTTYTLNLARILAALLPDDMEGSISTSPVSYKHWFVPSEQREVMKTGAENMSIVAFELYRIFLETGKKIHLNIEPEPDGLIENTQDVINFYEKYLLKAGIKVIGKNGLKMLKAVEIITEHVRICYDVCHFALAYEEPAETFALFKKHGIRIGKIQISSALQVMLPSLKERQDLISILDEFTESTYLHQVVCRKKKNRFEKFSDLPSAMESLMDPSAEEWRIHFHVPVFANEYKNFTSTNKQIIETLNLCKKQKICDHLEIETYTWDVLPETLKFSQEELISRELLWVAERIVDKKEKVNV